MEQQIPEGVQFIKILSTISLPGALVVIGYFAYKSLPLILEKFKPKEKLSNMNEIISGLEEFKKFKYSCETNHFTDLEELKKWRSDTDKTLTQMAQDIGYLKGRLNGNH